MPATRAVAPASTQSRAVSGVTGVRNVHLTTGGCGYLHAVIQVRKATQGDGKNAIMAAFAAHTSLKHVVVVDTDINILDSMDVEYAIAALDIYALSGELAKHYVAAQPF